MPRGLQRDYSCVGLGEGNIRLAIAVVEQPLAWPWHGASPHYSNNIELTPTIRAILRDNPVIFHHFRQFQPQGIHPNEIPAQNYPLAGKKIFRPAATAGGGGRWRRGSGCRRWWRMTGGRRSHAHQRSDTQVCWHWRPTRAAAGQVP